MPHSTLHDGKSPLSYRRAGTFRRPLTLLIGILAGPCMVQGLAIPAAAHDAPSGWSYPYSCCSMQDCRPVATKAISERPEGFVINVTGEVVPYRDARVRPSPDGEFHWCSVAGEAHSRTICLFVPPRAY